MPTKKEREYYTLGFRDGIEYKEGRNPEYTTYDMGSPPAPWDLKPRKRSLVKRKLSAWNKFVKANSNKKIYQYANGKLKLKKMGIAYRKKRR